MTRLDLGAALREAHLADPAAIPAVVARAAAQFGATDVVVYLVDFAQTTLEPIPDGQAHADLPVSEEVAATMAGRAFVDQHVTVAERQGGARVWVPIVEGSDRTGVLAMDLPEATDEVLAACRDLGLLTGHLIATQARVTDLYNLHRRRRALSLAASMQWDLLPPLVLKTSRLTVAALVEPAYEVGGDCFDYAVNGAQLSLAIMDAVGHGVASALIAALAIGVYRRDRREGRSLEHTHRDLDETLAAQLTSHAFATGQLLQIDLDTGTATWTNAGHPLPLLIRGGRVVAELQCPPTVPWGLGAIDGLRRGVHVASVALEPGDALLLYTDGVTEAHRTGEEHFGLDRLADLAGQHASDHVEPEEIIRRIVGAVLEHQEHLADDATLVLVRWHGPPS